MEPTTPEITFIHTMPVSYDNLGRKIVEHVLAWGVEPEGHARWWGEGAITVSSDRGQATIPFSFPIDGALTVYDAALLYTEMQNKHGKIAEDLIRQQMLEKKIIRPDQLRNGGDRPRFRIPGR